MTSIVGVDEAGRGPVLGPLVVGICCIPAQDEHLLVDAGVKDSKDLSRVRRRELEAWFHDMVVQRGWYGATVSLDAETIDMALQGEGLNWLEVDGFREALNPLPKRLNDRCRCRRLRRSPTTVHGPHHLQAEGLALAQFVVRIRAQG